MAIMHISKGHSYTTYPNEIIKALSQDFEPPKTEREKQQIETKNEGVCKKEKRKKPAGCSLLVRVFG